jgi:hypothetical protein
LTKRKKIIKQQEELRKIEMARLAALPNLSEVDYT